MIYILRCLVGYVIGILIFVVLIPFGLIELCKIDPIFRIPLTNFLTIRIVISSPLAIVGIIFMIWSNMSLFFIGKGGPTDGFNIAISPRTKKLVIVGPYRYTRNPMVFGAICTYTAIGLFMFSIVCLVILATTTFGIMAYIAITEEKRLFRDFGEEYVSFKKKVPMIFPRSMKY
jgi:protein-S-isoprenylcysteine O-methyltransferase Ste14